MADLNRYLEKIEKEQTEVIKKDFWAEYQTEILELRKKASRNCETYEDVKIYQGEIKAYDRVLNLPTKLISNVRERKRAIEQSNR